MAPFNRISFFDHPDARQQDTSILSNPLLTCTCRVLELFLPLLGQQIIYFHCGRTGLHVNVIEINTFFLYDYIF